MTIVAVDNAFRLQILREGNFSISPDLDPLYGALWKLICGIFGTYNVEFRALFPPNIIWVIKSRVRWLGSLRHVWGRGEVHTGLLGVNIEIGWRAGTRLIWLRVGTGGRLLWITWWALGFHELWGVYLTSWGPISLSRRTVLHGVG
jgi:hypothetical protein